MSVPLESCCFSAITSKVPGCAWAWSTSTQLPPLLVGGGKGDLLKQGGPRYEDLPRSFLSTQLLAFLLPVLTRLILGTLLTAASPICTTVCVISTREKQFHALHSLPGDQRSSESAPKYNSSYNGFQFYFTGSEGPSHLVGAMHGVLMCCEGLIWWELHMGFYNWSFS